jgi:ribosomal protein S18 acetylase RimI-like enzyme
VDFQPVEANLRESFRILAAGRPGGEIRETPGVFIAHAGVTFQMFNAAFLSAPVSSELELARRIADAAVFFQARGAPWAFWLCRGWLSKGLERRARLIFQKHGLRHVSEMPGMIAEEIGPPARRLPELDVRRVECEHSRRVFCEVGSACFHVPLAWFQEVFDTECIWTDFEGYVGLLRGEAVSTAAVVVTGNVLGVYNVATLPEHRRRGYGEAVMRFALDRARERSGSSRTILQSTQQGLRLYERIGYRTVTAVDVYAS